VAETIHPHDVRVAARPVGTEEVLLETEVEVGLPEDTVVLVENARNLGLLVTVTCVVAIAVAARKERHVIQAPTANAIAVQKRRIPAHEVKEKVQKEAKKIKAQKETAVLSETAPKKNKKRVQETQALLLILGKFNFIKIKLASSLAPFRTNSFALDLLGYLLASLRTFLLFFGLFLARREYVVLMGESCARTKCAFDILHSDGL